MAAAKPGVFKEHDLPRSAKRFLSHMSNIEGKSDKTIHEYYYDLRMFFRFMKCVRGLADFDEFDELDCSDLDDGFVKTISYDDIQEFLLYANRLRGNNANSRARKVSCLKSYFNYMASTRAGGILDVNVTNELKTPKLPGRQPIYLTLNESKRLLEAVDGEFKVRDYCIILLFLNCGMRLSELVGINVNDIKDDRLTVIGKGDKQRTLYLNPSCIDAINEYLKVRPTDNLKDRNALFLSKQRGRISNNMVYKMVQKNLLRAGLDPDKYSPHKLRHTAATLMFQHGNVDIRTLQEILGHEQLSTTQIYTNVASAQLQEAFERNPLADYKPE